MVDLHCHLLPGIDDGPRTIEEAVALARAAVAAGVNVAVATPHVFPGRYDNRRRAIEAAVTAFRRVLMREGIPLTVRTGGEVRIGAEVMQMVVDDDIPYLGVYAGYRTMLVEFPDAQLTPGAIRLMAWLLERHIRPVIAHPERNKEVVREPDRIRPYVALGCVLQITGASVLGQFGAAVRRCAQTLLEQGWVAAVATDAHNLQYRPPSLDRARAALEAMGGEHWARHLTETGPAALARQTDAGPS